MPWRIHERHAVLLRFQVGLCDIHRHATGTLLRALIQHPRQRKATLARCACLFLVAVGGAGVYFAKLMQELAHEGALAGIDVAEHNQM